MSHLRFDVIGVNLSICCFELVLFGSLDGCEGYLFTIIILSTYNNYIIMMSVTVSPHILLKPIQLIKRIKNVRDVLVFSHDQKKLHICYWYL